MLLVPFFDREMLARASAGKRVETHKRDDRHHIPGPAPFDNAHRKKRNRISKESRRRNRK